MSLKSIPTSMARTTPMLSTVKVALMFLFTSVWLATLHLYQSLSPALLKHILRASDFKEYSGHRRPLTWAEFCLRGILLHSWPLDTNQMTTFHIYSHFSPTDPQAPHKTQYKHEQSKLIPTGHASERGQESIQRNHFSAHMWSREEGSQPTLLPPRTLCSFQRWTSLLPAGTRLLGCEITALHLGGTGAGVWFSIEKIQSGRRGIE